MKGKITKTYTITTSVEVMERIDKLMALLHFNSRFGHSGIFGMSLDGDGHEKVTVEEMSTTHKSGVDLIGGVGYDMEMPCDHGFTGRFFDLTKQGKWRTQGNKLLRYDEVIKEIQEAR